MLTRDQKDLLLFLAESANDLATQAHWSMGPDAIEMRKEAEELMAIRGKILNRHWDAARVNQFELPFEMKQAA
jgi:hypothetical protein